MRKLTNFAILITTLVLLCQCDLINPIKVPELNMTRLNDNEYQVTMKGGKNSMVFYTIDGSKPTHKSNRYTTSVILPAGTQIRSVAYCPSGRHSQIVDTTITKEVSTKSLICR